MEAPAKGTVTPVASVFPKEEALKAAKRVEEEVEQKQNEMNRMNQFVADNSDLINLVKKLPEQLHHDIMVPFGKAAFFPGRLIHTNEFLVLLGENYYVDRTSKQTVDILKRRGKTLKSQVNSLKALVEDLRTQASFFTATASEAAEGLVEIREDYVEENSTGSASGLVKQGSSSLSEGENAKAEVEDEEFARMMSKLDELEMEELRGESDGERDERQESDAEESDSDVDEHTEAILEKGLHQTLDPKQRYSEEFQSLKPSQPTIHKNTTIELLPDKYQHQKDYGDKLNCTGLTVQPLPKETLSDTSSLPQNMRISNPIQMASTVSKGEAKAEPVISWRTELPVQKFEVDFDSSKAFTGSIVEHTHNAEPKTQGETAPSQTSGSQKPVSRFKMQRR